MRIIIAGSRSFSDRHLLYQKMDALVAKQGGIVTVISGTAKGADKLGEEWARDRGYPVKRYPADWDAYGKSAGYKRNVEMAEDADACVVFWDGESKGAKHMIDIAKEHGLNLRVVRF
jgi:hypothetical protein